MMEKIFRSRYGLSSSSGSIINENGEILTNFGLRVKAIFYSPEDGCTPELLRLCILHLNQKFSIDLDLRDPHLLHQLQRKLPTCKVLKASASAVLEAYLVELLEYLAYQTPPLYFRQHGFHQLKDGCYVFVAGDEVLGLTSEKPWAISPNVARAHLAYDGHLSCEDAIRKFWSVLERDGDVVLPVWGFTLVSAMRSQLTGLSGTTYPTLVVTGNQGFGKTTVCQRFCLLYGDKQKNMRHWAQRDMRSSSASTIEALGTYRDQVVLLDDMAKSIAASEVRVRKELMAEVLRFASNETNRTKMAPNGQAVDNFCTAGAVFNSEYALDNPSDIGRTVIVHIAHEMQDGVEIERTYAATVFRYFVQWLLPWLDLAISILKKRMTSVNGSYQRLRKNHLMVLWALEMFFHFVADSGALPQDAVNKMSSRSQKICDNLLEQQIKRIENLSGPQNIGWHILAGIQNKIIEETSEKVIKKGKKLPLYYYIHRKEDDLYCIPTTILYRYCLRETPLRFSSTIAMNKQLIQEGLIHPDTDGKAAAVRIDGKRYLGMRHVDLVVAANEACQ